MAAVVAMPASVWAADKALPFGPSDTFRVLFIGNSHLFVNNVPARVQHLLRPVKGRTIIKTFARSSARLSNFAGRADVAAALQATHWDVVVLQEATASFLSQQGRRGFHDALKWFSQRVPAKTRIVLFQTWPWRADSRYFAGTSSSFAKLWEAIQLEYGRAAGRARITIAPVGPCWMRSPKRASYYSTDGNHASFAGSNLAASIITRTILGGQAGRC